MKRMLFNATQAEELRVAIVDGQKLIDLDIESAGKEQRKSNIYKGVITRVEPSLEAAFVDYGAERHGFLPFKEISRIYLKDEDGEFARARIQSILKEGQELIVQIDKDERGNKGAALTTFISLAGRYLVLMPNNPRGGGVSRRVEGEERAELRDLVSQLEVPAGMSVIARTAGIGRSVEELRWDLSYLQQLWHAIEEASLSQPGPFLIYQEGSLVIRAIRDLFQPEIGEILIDTDSVYEQARQFMSHVMPANVNKVKYYRDDVPLFSRFQIEHQIETAYRRDVTLPSGGAVIIDHTEALVSVDVNSARATRGADIEQTALNTNLEAADEIARQLRLRDLGGLIVIDFIDMENQRNQREVENRLKEALHHDRARVQMGKISRFGLLELSRQRLQPSLGESSHNPCPRCGGTGHIRDTESSALHILRILQEEAMKENTALLRALVPVDVATFLLNEKRADIHTLEARHKVSIVLIPNPHLETPNYTVERLKHDATGQESLPSYKLIASPAEEEPEGIAPKEPKPLRQQPVVRDITPDQPAPHIVPVEEHRPSFLARMFGWFKHEPETAIPPSRPAPVQQAARQQQAQRPNTPRPESRGEPGERRGPRRDRADARPTAAAEGNGSRNGRNQERPRQQQRPPKQKQPQGEAEPAIAASPVPEPVRDAQPPAKDGGEGRKRGRRGRRDRGGHETRGVTPPPQPAVPAEQTAAAAMVHAEQRLPEPVTQAAPEPQVKEITAPIEAKVEQQVPPSIEQAIPERPRMPVQSELLQPIETQRSISADSADLAQEQVRAQRNAPRRRPHSTPLAAEAQSELVLVETNPVKTQVSTPELELEGQPNRPRTPRRRSHAPGASEPLIQVETQK